MRCFNPHFDINKLALIAAILVVLGDFIELLAVYQEFCDSRTKGNGNGGSVDLPSSTFFGPF